MSASAGTVVVDDLISGLNEWRNIQDVVRLTFKAFHDVLRAQGEAIKTLEQAVESKASKAEVAAALQAKANASDVSARLMELNMLLSAKPELGELDGYVAKADLSSAMRTHRADVAEAIAAKADAADVSALRESTEELGTKLRHDVSRKVDREDVAARLELKADRTELAAGLAARADAAEVAAALQDKASRKELTAGLNRKANKADLEPALVALRDEQESASRTLHEVAETSRQDKADRREVAELRDLVGEGLKRARDEARKAEATARDEAAGTAASLRQLSASVDQTLHALQSRAEETHAAVAAATTRVEACEERCSTLREQISEAKLKASAAASTAHSELHDPKASRGEIATMLDAKADVTQVNAALAHKANISAVNTAIERLESSLSLAASKQDLSTKVDMQDCISLLDAKAATADVNVALAQVSKLLEDKAGVSDLQKIVHEQGVINASLCAESSVGRWIWKSGRTGKNGGVPWNIQSANTDPENFLWEKDKQTILTVAPGLYEVTFGFFTPKKPSVQLLVNGEPVLAAVNSSSYVVHHSSGRLTSVGRHPAGCVTGLTLIDFLALPPKAKLALTYTGPDVGEGFFSLRKL
mmetsp:Transcript_19903/g.64787  ORF Transcript_19903/g.64787 Transcript_19903/m.64787 type:complete len:595 (-) Transcript_19903:899-2683(-)